MARGWSAGDRASWLDGHPRLGSLRACHVGTKEPDAAWRERFEERGANGLGALPARMDSMVDDAFRELAERCKEALRDGLLQAGGWESCAPALDDDLGRILERGILVAGDTALLRRGRPCGCHDNSVARWARRPASSAVMTGYALSDDGLWRVHSWVAEVPVGGGEPGLVETTEPRLLYFGYMRTPEETMELAGMRGESLHDAVERMREEMRRGLDSLPSPTAGMRP